MNKWLRVIALVAAVGLVAAACGDNGDGGGGDGGDGDTQPVTLATTSAGHAYVGQWHANDLFGDQFGLPEGSDVVEFEDESTANQVLVSGEAEMLAGGLSGLTQLIQQGQDLRAFCPVQIDSTEHLAGLTDKITSLDQITDPDIRVAVDSPGGLVNFIMNLVFYQEGMGITVNDLQNVIVLGDGSARLAALASGDADVGSVDLFELPDLEEQIGAENVTVLSVTAEDADFIANVLYAKKAWLDDNIDLAARWCATLLYSNRVLASDYEQYRSAVETFIEGGVDEEIIQTNWDFARKYSIWPYNTDVMTPEAIQEFIDIAIQSELLEESARELSFEDVVDTRPMELAMEMLGGPVTTEEVLAGNIPEPQA